MVREPPWVPSVLGKRSLGLCAKRLTRALVRHPWLSFSADTNTYTPIELQHRVIRHASLKVSKSVVGEAVRPPLH